ncbi:MAG TPA: Xaa-Pro peptidase family protein [Gemmatimonadaceae bacterium]|nr:Xaa-Pro peptidase family protein [Gemmatimonadaceae bacterium]
MLTPATLPAFQRALAEAEVDGWLLYDFRGANPIARELLGVGGHVTRRFFVWVPASGAPTAVTHAIEQGVWREWPAEWRKERYSSWRSLEEAVGRLVHGKRVAMEYSAGDAVPYLDRIPAGVIELVRAAGATVVSSGNLVSRFHAAWTDEQLASHRRTAETIAAIARDALRFAGEQARGGRPTTEHELQARIMAAFARAGLETDHPPNVSVGANAANPHYEPSAERVQLLTMGNLLLIDLWAREPGGVYADQTWMASLGPPGDKAVALWNAVRDARDAALALLRDRAATHTPVRGADVDDAARRVIEACGHGEFFTHRTGHSIDPRELHGSGPNLDNLETREERLLVPGVGFSVEPGIYIPGELGVRSEVNVFFGDGELVVTPAEYQRELMLV